MSLPSQLVPSLTPEELEFIACSHETIEIIPLFNMDRIRLISVSTSARCLESITKLGCRYRVGRVRAVPTAEKGLCTTMACDKSQSQI